MTNEEARERLEDWSPWQDIGDYDRFREALNMAIKALEQQPQRPKGKWIIRRLVNPDTMNEDIRIFECSECRIARRELITDHGFMNYCPNCGASMKYER